MTMKKPHSEFFKNIYCRGSIKFLPLFEDVYLIAAYDAKRDSYEVLQNDSLNRYLIVKAQEVVEEFDIQTVDSVPGIVKKIMDSSANIKFVSIDYITAFLINALSSINEPNYDKTYINLLEEIDWIDHILLYRMWRISISHRTTDLNYLEKPTTLYFVSPRDLWEWAVLHRLIPISDVNLKYNYNHIEASKYKLLSLDVIEEIPLSISDRLFSHPQKYQFTRYGWEFMRSHTVVIFKKIPERNTSICQLVFPKE